MSQIKGFIDRYFSSYLRQSRKSGLNKKHMPPNEREIEELMLYLQQNGADPVIVGSTALIKHMKPSEKDITEGGIRLTEDLDLFVSRALPQPPTGWRRDSISIGVISWIAPSGGYVDFLVAGHTFPDNTTNPQKVGKDPESEKMGCPVADIVSIYLLKLNSYREKDLTDLLAFARVVGIPKELDHLRLNKTQKDNLSMVKIWIAHDHVERSPFAPRM